MAVYAFAQKRIFIQNDVSCFQICTLHLHILRLKFDGKSVIFSRDRLVPLKRIMTSYFVMCYKMISDRFQCFKILAANSILYS